MSGGGGVEGPGVELDDQRERTLLSWRRTALSMVAVGLLVAHFSAGGSRAVLTSVLVGLAAVVAFVWLHTGVRTAAAALAMVLGVVLLGAVALLGILGPGVL